MADTRKLTFAQLKRDAMSGKMKLEMKIRCGKPVSEKTPARLLGKRRVFGANTVALKILTSDGKEVSELRINRASLVSYDRKTLTIYQPGYRKMTPDEERIMQEWNEIQASPEFRRQLENDCLSDGSTCFRRKEAFFRKAKMQHLTGYETSRGLRLDRNRYVRNIPECIRDESLKGDVMMRYDVFFEEDA